MENNQGAIKELDVMKDLSERDTDGIRLHEDIELKTHQEKTDGSGCEIIALRR